MTFAAYLPMDRYVAMADNTSLPARTRGAALFADISGFTPLTETLANELGARRGGEELTHHLNTVYDALIDEVHRYHGSVIYFSGDAITCWFDGEEVQAALRAVTTALKMQDAMKQIALIKTPAGKELKLELKVAVSAGTVSRLIVGDPEAQLLDVLAGSIVAQLATAEHLAGKGEVVITRQVYELLQEKLLVREWREDQEIGAGFAIVVELEEPAQAELWPEFPEEAVIPDSLRPWVAKPIYQRLEAGMSDFLTELRPAVALFIRFDGIDYDNDPGAEAKLDNYIRWLQSVLKEYDSNHMDITIGDKGSYLYIAFGAPVAHQNDPERAVRAAYTILTSPPTSLNWLKNVQIGISRGTMRTGTVGSKERHVYGVMGDEVNLAARLMGAAKPGQALISGNVHDATENLFEWEPLPPLSLKGKSEPVRVYRLIELKEQLNPLSQTLLHYSMPIVGRQQELDIVDSKIGQVLAGEGQVIAITAEAGMGKSRMVAEIIRLATDRHLDIYYGECQSYGTNNSYLPWQAIFRNFFKVGLHPEESLEEQIASLEEQLETINPALVNRIPLLKSALKLPIPENELTLSLDAKLRKTSLEGLLVDCIRFRSRNHPLVIVLEDCHWLDPLSHDLLENIGRAIYNRPILIVIAYRPPEIEYLQAPRITLLPNCTLLPLSVLSPSEERRFIRLKMNQAGLDADQLPESFITAISSRGQGNPFYIMELLNYLNDLKLDPEDPRSLEQMELPNSLHSLILSRIDRLSETQKLILKIASVIGRVFKTAWLHELLPNLDSKEMVVNELEDLRALDITPIEQPEPDLSYMFNHIVTREVTYESMPFSQRTALHGRLGDYIERQYAENLDQYVDLLAYHYYLSPDEKKKRHYLKRAGEIAQATYSNNAAIEYYQRLLPLLPEEEQLEVKLKLGEVLELLSQWGEAEDLFRQSLETAEKLHNLKTKALSLGAIGSFLIKQKRYTEAEPWLRQALSAFTVLEDPAGVSKTLAEIGDGYRLQGEYKLARDHFEQSLRVAKTVHDRRQSLAVRALALRNAGTASLWQGDLATAGQLYEECRAILLELGDKPNLSKLLSNMGVVAHAQGLLEESLRLTEQSLAQFRELGDRLAVSVALNNLGVLTKESGSYDAAKHYLEEGLTLQQRLGNKSGMAINLSTLGDVLIEQGNYEEARQYLTQALTLDQELGNPVDTAYVLEYLASVATGESRNERAAKLAGAANAIRTRIEVPLLESEQAPLRKRLEPAQTVIGEEKWQEAWQAGQVMTMEQAVEYALNWEN